MKWLLRSVLIVVLLIAVAGVVGYFMLDQIATTAVTKGAAFATQTDAECEGVSLGIVGGTGSIDTLDIKNPDGPFREVFDSFLVLGKADAGITVGSVLSDQIEIPKVELSDITISLVSLPDGSKNYETILESLKRFKGDQAPPETEDQKKVVIRELTIRNITVNYDFASDPVLGALPLSGSIMIADKEPMILKDIGAGGQPISAVTADIIADILVQVTANLAGSLGGHLEGLASSLIDSIGVAEFGETLEALNLQDSLKVLGDIGVNVGELGIDLENLNLGGDAIQGVGEDAGDAINNASDQIKQGIGGLLNRNRNEDDDQDN